MEKSYEEIAKKYNVDIAEVKWEMQSAIDNAYKNAGEQNIPTIEEFLYNAVTQILNTNFD